jgi:elongation factor G
MDSKGKYQVIKAKTPLAELDRYSTSLRSITQGRASFTGKFVEYSPVPRDIQGRLAKKYLEIEES